MDPFIGEIKMVAFNFAPRGYSSCNGALVSIAQNSALFSLLGTTFGGDGVQTLGNGPGLPSVVQGEKAGTTAVTILPTQMPGHNHPVALSIAIPASTAAADTQVPGPTTVLAAAQFGTDRDVTLVSAYVSTAANTTLPPFNSSGTTGLSGGSQQGVFPSRN
jgi:microcystin-dependent protein